MTTQNPAPPVTLHRGWITANTAAATLLLLALAFTLNYLGFRHHRQWDFSRDHSASLSSRMTQILATLPAPTTITVWFDPEADLYDDVDRLLRQCADASHKKLKIEYIDPRRNLDRARELFSKYKFKDTENVIVVDSGTTSKFLYEPDMAQYAPPDILKPKPDILAFTGEEKLASALLEVHQPEKPKVYVLQGHSEIPILDPANLKAPDPAVPPEKRPPYSEIIRYLSNDNIQLLPLSLLATDKVPEDAAALLIAGPQYDLSEREAQILQTYWTTQRARLLVLLDPNATPPRLWNLLADLGLGPRDNRVLRTLPIPKSQDLIAVIKDVSFTFNPGSPITTHLSGVQSTLAGGTQSFKIFPERASAASVAITPLLTALDGYWGETDYTAPQVFNEPSADDQPPLILGASIERNPVTDTSLQVSSSRLVALGNCQILRNEALTGPSLDFLLGSTSWLLDRQRLSGIASKPRNRYLIRLAPEQLANIWLSTVLAMPASAALLGALVWWRRRR